MFSHNKKVKPFLLWFTTTQTAIHILNMFNSWPNYSLFFCHYHNYARSSICMHTNHFTWLQVLCRQKVPLWPGYSTSLTAVEAFTIMFTCGFSHVCSDYLTAWTFSHTPHICRDIHLCGSWGAYWECLADWTVSHTPHICRDIHLCGSSCVF